MNLDLPNRSGIWHTSYQQLHRSAKQYDGFSIQSGSTHPKI